MAEKEIPGNELMLWGVGLAATGAFVLYNVKVKGVQPAPANGNRAVELVQRLTQGWDFSYVAYGMLLVGIVLLGIGVYQFINRRRV